VLKSFRDDIFTDQTANQQCQSTEGEWLVFQYRPHSNQGQPTMLQYYTQKQENTRIDMENIRRLRLVNQTQ